MSLRDSLKGTVARCTPHEMQHATTDPASATAHATAAQQPTHRPRVDRATAYATTAQQSSCTRVETGAIQGHPRCTDLAAALAAAINRACDVRGDSDTNRAGLLAECAALPPEGQADMLAHFTLEAVRR